MPGTGQRKREAEIIWTTQQVRNEQDRGTKKRTKKELKAAQARYRQGMH